MLEQLSPLREMPTWACTQTQHNYISCQDCQQPPYSFNNVVREVNVMFFETVCFSCGFVYQWHREHLNQCPRCHWNCGFFIDITRGIGELKDFVP